MSAAEPRGCRHYRRNCELLAPCCGNWVSCRFCHNEGVADGTMMTRAGRSCGVEEMDRRAVKRVRCLLCRTEQPPTRTCQSCSNDFACYWCPVCIFYDDTPEKKIWHCTACGLCRVAGKGLSPTDYQHCSKCNTCLPRGEHKCTENLLHSACPICFELMFTSTSPCSTLACGHSLHCACLKKMLKKGLSCCPTCGRECVDTRDATEALDQEIAETPMPEEYRNLTISILCKQCHTVSSCPFHVLGLKCQHCGSYNTCRN